jgi:Flp pilus assembly pilin Flp
MSLNRAWTVTNALRKDADGIVMVEWVALAGIFVVILVVTFLAIGGSANTIVEAVNTQLCTIVEAAELGACGVVEG